MTTLSLPAATMRASSSWSSSASGVVLRSSFGTHVIADADEDRADLAGTPAGAAKQLGGQGGDGRLAVGAGHADHLQPLGGAAEPLVRRISQGTAGPVYHQLRDGDARQLALDDEAHGACLDGGRGVVVAVDVDPGDGEEQRAGHHLAGVISECRHLPDRDADDSLGTNDVGQRTEAHPSLLGHRRSQPRSMPVAVRRR